MSESHFHKVFKREMGVSPTDFINGERIQKAKELLVSSDDSISGIAYTLGFNYPHYFSRMFKSKTGHTPVEFRNLN